MTQKQPQDVVYEIVHLMIFNEIPDKKISLKDTFSDPEAYEISNTQATRKAFIWPEALRIIKEFGLKQKQIDALAVQFIEKLENTQRWGSSGNMRFVTEILKLGASQQITERAVAITVKFGFKMCFDELTEYLKREPTEDEAFALVFAETKSAARGGGNRLSHPFMTDRELTLFNWGKQYIKDPEKLKELEDSFRQRDYDWKNDLF